MPLNVRQRDITDCGAACIASVASYHHLNLSVSGIRQLASTGRNGTNVMGLLEALDKLGFQAKGVRGTLESLSKIPTPAIAHVVKGELHHYVVIYRATNRSIKVMDPADGKFHRYKPKQFGEIWAGILVIMVPGMQFKTGSRNPSWSSRFWQLVSPHSRTMIEAFAGALAYTLIGLTTSIYVQKIVDYVLIAGNQNLLNLMSVIMIVLLLLQVFIGAIKSILTLHTGQSIDALLILGYYKHLLRLPQPFFDTMRVGEIISRINDAVKIRVFINEALTNMTVNALIVALSFALMFTYYWKLALLILVVIPFYVVIYALANLLNQKLERKLMESGADLETHFVESLNSIRTIKAFGLEEHAGIGTETRFMALLKRVYTSGLNSVFSVSSSEFLSRLFTIILLWVGAGFVLQNEITPGELLSFYALMGYFTGPVNSLIGSNKVVQNALIAADRLFEIMDLEIESQSNPIPYTPNDLTGDIRFEKVTFHYGSRDAVFDDLSLQIEQGKVTALVGESGCGKSTLIGLLQKLYPVHSGQVYIGEHNLANIATKSIRSQVGVVPQKIDLFAGPIVENIAIGVDQPDMAKVTRICSALGIMEFIGKLPNGLNTCLGENGATLSGGQIQRIAIARALYRDPQILILDEATSSLDSASEEYVQRIIERMREKGKTVILIAHRLSTVIHADKIAVLQEGRIMEEGTHEELVHNNSVYSRLWKQQVV